MKSKITDCITCRKTIYKEAEEAYLKHEYAFFRDSARSFAVFAVCGVLTAMIRRGRTPQYIRQLYSNVWLDVLRILCRARRRGGKRKWR